MPVVLPLLAITIGDAGTATEAGGGRLDVTLNGEPHPVPAGAGEGRSALGPLIEQVTTELGCPVRIEVREVDGTVFTDLIRARKPTPPPPDDEPAGPGTQRSRRAKHTTQHEPPVLIEVTGDGFVPGEHIAVAVIVAHTDATGTGAARALLDQQQLDAALPEGDDAGEAVLYGRISGTIVVRRVP